MAPLSFRPHITALMGALISQILSEHVNETSSRVVVEDQLGLVLAGTSLTPLRVAGMFSSVGEVCEGFTGVAGYELDDQERFGTKVAAGCGGDGVSERHFDSCRDSL